VIRLFFGLITVLADAVPEPARVAAARSSNAGLYVAALAFVAAVAVSGVVLIRRRKG
jgi:hypothetical protein